MSFLSFNFQSAFSWRPHYISPAALTPCICTSVPPDEVPERDLTQNVSKTLSLHPDRLSTPFIASRHPSPLEENTRLNYFKEAFIILTNVKDATQRSSVTAQKLSLCFNFLFSVNVLGVLNWSLCMYVLTTPVWVLGVMCGGGLEEEHLRPECIWDPHIELCCALLIFSPFSSFGVEKKKILSTFSPFPPAGPAWVDAWCFRVCWSCGWCGVRILGVSTWNALEIQPGPNFPLNVKCYGIKLIINSGSVE